MARKASASRLRTLAPVSLDDAVPKQYVDSAIASAQTIQTNTQSGTTYTLALSDSSKSVEVSNASPISITIPPNSSVSFPIGTVVEVVQAGEGQITLVPGSGVTLNNANGLKTAKQWSIVTLRKRATDTWIVAGDVKA